MENVDQLICHSLRKIGCDIDAGVCSLRELNTEQTVEAVVKCLGRIDGSWKSSSATLPPTMTARYRFCAELASKIKDLGFRGEVGYQTILYGSEIDLRQILIFLIEKLPKEAEAHAEDALSPISSVRRKARDVIRADLEATWVPWFCLRNHYKWDGRFWTLSEGNSLGAPFKAEQLNWPSSPDYKPFQNQVSQPRRLVPSVLEYLTAAGGETASGSQQLQNETVLQLLQAAQDRVKAKAKPPVAARKPKLMPKPKHLLTTPVQAEDKSTEDAQAKAESEEAKKVQQQISSLQTEMEELQAAISETKRNLNSRAMDVQTVDAEIAQLRHASEMDQQTQARRKLAKILPNAGEALRRLETFVCESEERMGNLQTQWESARTPLEQELRQLRNEQFAKSPAVLIYEEINAMNSKIETIESEFAGKESFVQQLQGELEKQTSGPGRSSYTKRILDIVANIKKQREEIDRVLSEIRSVQKDINMLTGKLDRSFLATDELVFRDTVQEEVSRRIYRLLVAFHEKCVEIRQSAENTGQLLREIKDLEDQVETETQKSTESTLEKLLNDYYEIKQENEKLVAKLQA